VRQLAPCAAGVAGGRCADHGSRHPPGPAYPPGAFLDLRLGELVGGADITEELASSGELQQKLDDALGADRAQDVKVVELQLA
jgi:hypothetical protein